MVSPLSQDQLRVRSDVAFNEEPVAQGGLDGWHSKVFRVILLEELLPFHPGRSFPPGLTFISIVFG